MIEYEVTPVPLSARGHLLYALNFCDQRIKRASIEADLLTLELTGPADDDISRKVKKLIARYAKEALELSEEVLFSTGDELQRYTDPFPELVDSGVVVPLGAGRAVFRGWFANLLEFIDEQTLKRVANPMGAVPETYPNAIAADKLAKTHHVGSFPEHLNFLTHLREDLDVIDGVADMARDSGSWNDEIADLVQSSSKSPQLIMNPSVCYHCYASREDTKFDGEGKTVTARSRCHRYEGKALEGINRLQDFDMREIIFLGHPDYVKQQREHVESLMETWMKQWQIASKLINANDPFFTDDFEVKATFQRRQSLKHELTVALPSGNRMAIFSSNFHSVTFGKAFNITRKGRPICTGCVGFGLERWAYAIVTQFGCDPLKWPTGIKEEFQTSCRERSQSRDM